MSRLRYLAANLTVEQKIVVLILIAFLIRGLIYIAVVPLWDAPDEPRHYRHAQIVHVQTDKHPDFKPDALYNVEGGGPDFYSKRPPLYYHFLSSASLSFIPQADVFLRAYWMRLLNLGLGLMMIFVLFRLSKETFPDNPVLSLAPAFIVAFLPQIGFMSSTINSDNMSNLFWALFLWLSVRLIKSGIRRWEAPALLLVLFAQYMTENSFALMFAVALLLGLFLLFRTTGRKGIRLARIGFAAAATAISAGVLATFGPIRRLLVSNDYAGWIFSGKDIDLVLGFFSRAWIQSAEITRFTSTFFANFGWEELPIPKNVTDPLITLWLVSVAGILLYCTIPALRSRFPVTRPQALGLAFLGVTCAGVFVALVYYSLKGDGATSGRYLLPVAGAWAILLVFGFMALFDRKYHAVTMLTICAGILGLDLWVLHNHLLPAYISNMSLSGTNYSGAASNSAKIVLEWTFHNPALAQQHMTLARPSLFQQGWYLYGLIGSLMAVKVALGWLALKVALADEAGLGVASAEALDPLTRNDVVEARG